MKETRIIHGIGERLLMIRKTFKKTQEEMGFIVNSMGWGGYEKEQSTPGANVISELCLLGINANWLLTGKGPLLRNDISIAENPAANEIISFIKEHAAFDKLLLAAIRGTVPVPIITPNPAPATAPNPMGAKKCFSYKLRGGFQDPAVRQMVMDLRRQGVDFAGIEAAIRDAYPNNPEKHKSRSAIHRFYQNARNGRLLEYGIGRTI